MRHDHTSWLIHFVRDRNPEQDFPEEIEEEFDYFSGGELEPDADAFSVLKTIIRLGGLYPGYSFRSGRTTIYGGKPAICVTEMPLYSFATYAKERGKTDCVSAYGIAFLKSEFFSAGGRPVIYGLSNSNVKYIKNEPYCRIFEETILPLEEQYRYVAYSLSSKRWIDWSHEREWRWKVNNKDGDYVWGKRGDGCYDAIPGLPLFVGKENEGYFSRLCVIVWTNEEAKLIQDLITGFYFAESNDYGTPFSKKLIENSFIVVLENVVSQVEVNGSLSSQTIEGLQDIDLITTIILADTPKNVQEIIDQAIKKARVAGKAAAEEYKASHDISGGYCGFANAVTYDITNPLVQYMLNEGIASGPYDGCVHINIKSDWEFSQSLDYKEYIYDAVANALEQELGFSVYMQSRSD
ncbi:hypothetical protein [Marichromatium sp. AB32]|uniref:hypothetical protein n=1 Tax=Marichromatium sp. AB32 TaxID=2483363 RepID=UPI0011CE1FC6|nr:hypothetical protein [Marichromatium sp. AB32]